MDRRLGRSLGAGLVVFVMHAGCEDDPVWPDREPDFSSRHLDIWLETPRQVCAGDLADLDDFVHDVGPQLGAESDVRIGVLIVPVAELRAWCPIGAGCARPGGTVVTQLAPIEHELVHELTFNAGLGYARPLWAEGLATAFAPGTTTRGEGHPAALLGDEPPHLDYALAGAFVRWLWPRDPARFLAVYRASDYEDDPAQARAGFDAVYGAGALDALGDAFVAEAPWESGPLRVPVRPELPWTGPVWEHRLVLDCEARDTRSDGSWLARAVDVRVSEGGRFILRSTADETHMVPIDPWLPMRIDAERDELLPVVLEPGVHRIRVARRDAGEVTVGLWPDWSPVPADDQPPP